MSALVIALQFVVFAVAVLVASTAGAGSHRAAPLEIRLNHVPVVVSDLDEASHAYRRLGFSLKEGRPHANGLVNRHVKFPDGTEVELITAPRAVDSLTRYYQEAARQGDGPAFLSLFTNQPDEVLTRARESGTRAERDGEGLTWPRSDPLGYLFFAPLNHSPTDRPEHFAHANSATSLIGVTLAGPLDTERRLLRSLGLREEPAATAGAPERVRVALEGGDLYLDPRAEPPARCPVTGVTLAVSSLDQALRMLRDAGISARVAPAPARSATIDAGNAHGLAIELREL